MVSSLSRLAPARVRIGRRQLRARALSGPNGSGVLLVNEQDGRSAFPCAAVRLWMRRRVGDCCTHPRKQSRQYAKGEITQDECERMKQDIGGDT